MASGLAGLMLGVAGYGIGSNCTPDTFLKMSQETLGILGASLFTLGVSVAVAIHMHRHTFANLLSSIMGCLPGGLTAMTVLMDDYEEADENVVVVSQCLRLFVVEVSVPFLAINCSEARSPGPPAPVCGSPPWVISGACSIRAAAGGPPGVPGPVPGPKDPYATGQLLGPILITSLFALWQGSVPRVPAPAMAFAQLHIGLYIGTMMDREKTAEDPGTDSQRTPGFPFDGGFQRRPVPVHVPALRFFHPYRLSGPGPPEALRKMCLTGLEMHQDVAVILTYQLVRVLMLAMGVPFVIRRFFKPDSGKKRGCCISSSPFLRSRAASREWRAARRASPYGTDLHIQKFACKFYYSAIDD